MLCCVILYCVSHFVPVLTSFFVLQILLYRFLRSFATFLPNTFMGTLPGIIRTRSNSIDISCAQACCTSATTAYC